MNNRYYENNRTEQEPETEKRESRLGFISMMCGIFGLAGVTLEFAIAALILSISAKRRDGKFHTKSRLGFIFGIVGIGMSILAGVFIIIGLNMIDAAGGLPALPAYGV